MTSVQNKRTVHRMNTIAVPVTTLRDNLAVTLDEVANKETIALLTKRGNPVSALVNIDLLEDLLAMTNKKYLREIKEARAQYKRGEFFTHEEVFGDL